MVPKFFAFAALVALPGLAFGQNMANDGGPFEVTVNASGSNNREFTTGAVNVGGSVGFLPLPFLEVAVRDGFSYADPGTGYTWNNTVQGAIDFEIPLDRFEPYVGANVGYFATHNNGSSPEAAPEAGLKFFFTKNVFIYGQVEYDFYWRKTGNTFNNGSFDYIAGLGFRF